MISTVGIILVAFRRRHFPGIMGDGHPSGLYMDFLQSSKVSSLKTEVSFDMTKCTLHVRFVAHMIFGNQV
ncbi:hypothetical protein B0W44_04400 [Novibacillus thermophilus]|uniref:Uncharacterized protein n=1 Tax=Novibacillus thermophilus TaxID=1471761 RepID=A0A1U9K527_9BACL|nr:hypothetical protein B0W44_04400 [Novibacillus thermophilus]